MTGFVSPPSSTPTNLSITATDSGFKFSDLPPAYFPTLLPVNGIQIQVHEHDGRSNFLARPPSLRCLDCSIFRFRRYKRIHIPEFQEHVSDGSGAGFALHESVGVRGLVQSMVGWISILCPRSKPNQTATAASLALVFTGSGHEGPGENAATAAALRGIDAAVRGTDAAVAVLLPRQG
ncbi:hypothetical protein B0H13DRAFT_1915382 [Mycena leptocephala]|nr:hypothetical protein B0H13DRAFT_1915382 [Mycena leptocephala]